MTPQKITPCLWYDGQAEEAAAFYTSVFPDSGVTKVTPGPGGAALVVEFHLSGVRFIALNGGPQFKFTEAVSLSVDCRTQAEVDELWDKLISDGGKPSVCGWLKDKYGLSWQLVPSVLPQLLSNPATAGKVMPVLMGMTKPDIAALLAAAN